MNTVLVFKHHNEGTTAYRIHGKYKLIEVEFNISLGDAVRRFLRSDTNALLNEETNEWTTDSGNHICNDGDHIADMGDYTVIAYDLKEIHENDLDLIRAMEKSSYGPKILGLDRK